MKVKPKKLLLIAGIVWLFAGLNVSVIGLSLYSDYLEFWNILLSALVFSAFYFFIFLRLVKKHSIRIRAYQTKQWFFHFFDLKSFIIMATMMSFGILLRKSGFASDHFIAVFYSGLGLALALAGVSFTGHYISK